MVAFSRLTVDLTVWYQPVTKTVCTEAFKQNASSTMLTLVEA